MWSWKALFVSVLALGTSSGAVLGGCDIAGLDAMPDGAWLVSLNGSWRPIDELSPTLRDGRPREVTFAYVAREPELTTFRRGILVIKTAVRASGVARSDRVTLARDAYKPVEKCESYPQFSGGSVKGRSYDDYHDYSYSAKGLDGPLLSSFHVSYAARVQGCKGSDDDTTDSYFTGHWQSNRSQFSFDDRVVAKGQNSQFFAQFGVTPAYASSMSERKVEMKRYTSDRSGLACVTFNATVRPGTLLRINDLERRVGLFRAAEQSWEWPR
ncbi:hypothetical protein QCM80_26755 [Bradyrhizobium sp. SSUT112]|uniref:hypothetical protein n=1 Tax=Bradyrhizobium sp. SSUT112 TaxID=3040604 RepID=UPI0024492FA3|nr:hypothetical protein [Bradyrhizobium sp. SSUT112]MDH2354240.1 hypothetical protein [Bradyrhizobium sp. SSUT112]